MMRKKLSVALTTFDEPEWEQTLFALYDVEKPRIFTCSVKAMRCFYDIVDAKLSKPTYFYVFCEGLVTYYTCFTTKLMPSYTNPRIFT